MHVKSYKVLFADDEYWTREKMARIIPWEKYSLEFLKPASDGEEVLERTFKEGSHRISGNDHICDQWV